LCDLTRCFFVGVYFPHELPNMVRLSLDELIEGLRW
jgi:hypothetical protein